MLREALELKCQLWLKMENFGHRNVHLRGWQRADLSDGEEAMMAERRETPFVQPI